VTDGTVRRPHKRKAGAWASHPAGARSPVPSCTACAIWSSGIGLSAPDPA
jgi:hypothetical protein